MKITAFISSKSAQPPLPPLPVPQLLNSLIGCYTEPSLPSFYLRYPSHCLSLECLRSFCLTKALKYFCLKKSWQSVVSNLIGYDFLKAYQWPASVYLYQLEKTTFSLFRHLKILLSSNHYLCFSVWFVMFLDCSLYEKKQPVLLEHCIQFCEESKES